MSLYITRSLHCDWPECFSDDWDGLPGQSVAAVRAQAVKNGWQRRQGGVDWCPLHAEKQPVQAGGVLVSAADREARWAERDRKRERFEVEMDRQRYENRARHALLIADATGMNINLALAAVDALHAADVVFVYRSEVDS